MSRIAAVGVGVIALGVSLSGQETSYSDEAIQAAIEIGGRDKVQDIRPGCTAEVGGFWNKLSENLAAADGWGGVRKFSVVGWSPLSRAAWIARDAKQKYMPTPQTSDDHIVATVADDVFVVRVTPQDLGNVVTAGRLADTGIEHVVIRPRGDKEGRETVQPLTVDVSGSELVSNLFGATFELVSVMATFEREAVLAIAERTDVEALVIAGGQEFKCNLDDTRILRGYRLGN